MFRVGLLMTCLWRTDGGRLPRGRYCRVKLYMTLQPERTARLPSLLSCGITAVLAEVRRPAACPGHLKSHLRAYRALSPHKENTFWPMGKGARKRQTR